MMATHCSVAVLLSQLPKTHRVARLENGTVTVRPGHATDAIKWVVWRKGCSLGKTQYLERP